MRISTSLIYAICILNFYAFSLGQTSCSQGLPPLEPYLTPHFSKFLNESGYQNFNFEKYNFEGGSYGGKSSDADTITNRPIVFVHGETDIAIGNGTSQYPTQTGFRDSIQYFISKGYKKSELYITTWGNGNPKTGELNYHSYNFVNFTRSFILAVLKYTNATKIDVIGHSMGVTLARKAIKGGPMTDHFTQFNLGISLSDKVENFIGIGGANYGMVKCEFLFLVPICGRVNGFYPGNLTVTPVKGLSSYLNDLDVNGGSEAENVVTFFTFPFDSVIGVQNISGRTTSEIRYQNNSFQYSSEDYSHFDIRDATCEKQYTILGGKNEFILEESDYYSDDIYEELSLLD